MKCHHRRRPIKGIKGQVIEQELISKKRTQKSLSDTTPCAYLVTLAFGDPEAPTLATVVFVSEEKGENTHSVAKALMTSAGNSSTQRPCFQWTTLKRQGNKTFSTKELAMLIEAAGRGKVGVGRVTPLKLH